MKRALILTSAALFCACGGAGDTDDIRTPDAPVNEIAAEPGDRVMAANDAMDHNSGTDYSPMEKTYEVMNSAGRPIGSVTITDVGKGVELMLDLTSIPEGRHAIHFHETGTCDGPDFTSAGGHYNPSGVNHGFQAEGRKPHAGDMRNFDAPQSGVVKTTIDNERVTLSARDGLAPLFDADGTALIIHAGADDYKSQPSGDAGGRIACAVIAP